MDLLKTLVLYMTMVYASSVQTMPDPQAYMEQYCTPTPTVAVTAAPEATPVPTPVPTVQVSPNPEYKALQMGDNGDAVLKLQQALAEYGYYEGELDGRYGNQTRMAVETFQYIHGLYADGIAGKYTLSVLYDSQQVRYAAPTATPTPPADNLTVALPAGSAQTEEPEQTFAPVVTEAPVAEPTVEPTAEPTAEPSAEPTEKPVETPKPTERPALESMDGWVIRLADSDQPLVTTARKGRETVTEAVLPCRVGEAVYLPLVPILEAHGILVISSTDRVDKLEIGYALNDHLYRLSFTEDRSGEPISLEAFCDDEVLPLEVADIREKDGLYYLPSGSVIALTGLAAEVDEAAQVVSVALPMAE